MERQFDYASFYECCYTQAVAYACGYIHDEEDARDVVGDVFLRLLELGGRLDTEKNVRALLLSMIHNSCMDYLRRLQCYCGVEMRLKQTADRFSDDEFTMLCQKELFRLVGQVLAETPDTEREIFCEIRLDGKNYQEVALEKNISRRSVEYQLKKVTKKVRVHLLRMYG